MSDLPCFKAYDIRGRVPDELNEDIAYRIGRAFVEVIGAKRVVVGQDVRLSSRPLCQALANGLVDAGAEVFDIGLCGTEEVYFATFHYQDSMKIDGGIMVTASHNPMDYNGMKLVRAGSRPVSGDTGLFDIRDLAAADTRKNPNQTAQMQKLDHRGDYVNHLLGYIDLDTLKPLKIVINPGNGGAGIVTDALQKHLPFEFIPVHHEPDGSFPNGIPNPLLPENRAATSQAVIDHGADFGVAWDGDFDRCFLFDEHGGFIEGYYIVGLLAQAMLQHEPGASIIHDPRLTWNTMDVVNKAGGKPICSKTGHAFIKERMREEDAIYGGEMSAHHYFRDFAYCDNGMIPWLLVAEMISSSGQSLSQLIEERQRLFPASGEINRKVADAKQVIASIEGRYAGQASRVDRTDGVSIDYNDWRFNLRSSNTEPVIRLNVESRENQQLMQNKTRELLEMIDSSS